MSALHLAAVAITFGALFLAIFSTVCGVSIVVLAFKEGGMGSGTFALLCAPYAAYWAAARSTHRRRWVLLTGWCLGLVLAVGMCFTSSCIRNVAGPLQPVPQPGPPAASLTPPAAPAAPIYPPN